MVFELKRIGGGWPGVATRWLVGVTLLLASPLASSAWAAKFTVEQVAKAIQQDQVFARQLRGTGFDAAAIAAALRASPDFARAFDEVVRGVTAQESGALWSPTTKQIHYAAKVLRQGAKALLHLRFEGQRGALDWTKPRLEISWMTVPLTVTESTPDPGIGRVVTAYVKATFPALREGAKARRALEESSAAEQPRALAGLFADGAIRPLKEEIRVRSYRQGQVGERRATDRQAKRPGGAASPDDGQPRGFKAFIRAVVERPMQPVLRPNRAPPLNKWRQRHRARRQLLKLAGKREGSW